METQTSPWPQLARRSLAGILVLLIVTTLMLYALSACGGGVPVEVTPGVTPEPRSFVEHTIYTEQDGDYTITCAVAFINTSRGNALAQSCWRE